MIFNTSDFVGYVVTGKTVYGQRFTTHTTDYRHAFGINLWNGRVWGRTKDGKRKLLKRVANG